MQWIFAAVRVRLPPLENSELAMRQFGISEMILIATPDLMIFSR